MDKRQLVDGCKRGDSASVEALYRGYSGKLMGICRHYVDSQEVAEDLLHDAFIVILSSIGQLKNPDKLDAWMGVIVKNMAIDYLKESRHFTHPQEDLDMEDVPDEPMYPVPPYEDLMALIDRLPEQYGKVFRLSVLEGLSHKEIGALLHIGENSSSSNLFRARQVLQKELKQYWLALLALIALIVTPLLLHKEAAPNGPVVVNNGADSAEVVISADTLAIPETLKPSERIRRADGGVPNVVSGQIDTLTLRERLYPISPVPLPSVTLQAPTPSISIRKPDSPTFSQPLLADAKPSKKKNLLGLLPSISALPGTLAGISPIVMGSGILADASSFVMAPNTKVTDWSDFLTAVQSMEGHYRTGDSLAYYNSLLGIAERLAVPDAMDPHPKPVEEKVEYERPFTLGLSASIGLNDRWSILTGLEYTRLRSSHTIGLDTLYIKNRQTIHYVGVPLGLSYTVWSKGNLHLNASAFGKMEIPVAGILNSEHHNGVANTYQNTLKFKAPIQWSAGVGIGLQYNLTPWMGLYVEPQVRYYFDTGGGIQTIRQVQPVEFAVPFGVRLTF
ncbi:MAG: sigma-70 family RNA polymerase sigma factor [Candidatus Cryptobacteroides sp.]|nr:sigma-70 family RNA polymerase sigma factor [Candidatus Cryptobacteroides sp.]